MIFGHEFNNSAMRVVLLLILMGMTTFVFGKEGKNLNVWTSLEGKELKAKGVSWDDGGVNVLQGEKEIKIPFKLLVDADVRKALDDLPYHFNDKMKLEAKTLRTTSEREERLTGETLEVTTTVTYANNQTASDVQTYELTEKYTLSGRTVEVKVSSPFADGVAAVEFYAISGKGRDRGVYSTQKGVFSYKQIGSSKLFSAEAVEDFKGWVVVLRNLNTGKVVSVKSSMRHLEKDVLPTLPEVVTFKIDTASLKAKVLLDLIKR